MHIARYGSCVVLLFLRKLLYIHSQKQFDFVGIIDFLSQRHAGRVGRIKDHRGQALKRINVTCKCRGEKVPHVNPFTIPRARNPSGF